MARVVDEAAQQVKRRAILDLAVELVQTEGYERMTIQGILDGLGISRGALYHYFDSKEALLEAMVDQMGADAAEALLPMVRDPELTALEKFHRYVDISSRTKASRPELIGSLLRTWYSRDNVKVRQKLTDGTLNYTAPMILEPIIRQGVAERTFTSRYPEQAARIIAGILLNLADGLAGLLIQDEEDDVVERRTRDLMAAYTDSIERILGATPGSLHTGDVDQLVALGRSVRTHGEERSR